MENKKFDINNFLEEVYNSAKNIGDTVNNFTIVKEKTNDSDKKENYGYHITDFPKGKLGEISKIQEELDELKDANKQNSKIMMLVELSDLYGAIEEYCKPLNITMEDLKIFSNITKRAFKNGRRS